MRFVAGFFLADFLAVDFFAVGFFAVGFLAVDLLAVVLPATFFFAALRTVFFVTFFAAFPAVFFAAFRAAFFGADFRVGALLVALRAADFFTVAFFFVATFFTRSEEHTSELQSLMCISYAVFCLKKKIPLYHIHFRCILRCNDR